MQTNQESPCVYDNDVYCIRNAKRHVIEELLNQKWFTCRNNSLKLTLCWYNVIFVLLIHSLYYQNRQHIPLIWVKQVFLTLCLFICCIRDSYTDTTIVTVCFWVIQKVPTCTSYVLWLLQYSSQKYLNTLFSTVKAFTKVSPLFFNFQQYSSQKVSILEYYQLISTVQHAPPDAPYECPRRTPSV